MEERRPAAAAAFRDWSELPIDPLASVLAKLGAVEVLMGAGLVCRSWLQAAKVPDMWRSVVMASHATMYKGVLCAMAKMAVDRSDGLLESFVATRFVSDDLLKNIGDRSPSLKSLGLVSCFHVSNEGLTGLTTKSPLLQNLALLDCPNVGGDEAFEVTGRACPQLRCLMVQKGWHDDGRSGGALGIATIRELRQLSLVGSDITIDELVAVVDSCPLLERLCVRDCHNVVVTGDGTLRARCAWIKTLELPPFYEYDELERYCSDHYDEIHDAIGAWYAEHHDKVQAAADCDEFDD